MIKKNVKVYRGIKCTEDKIFHVLYRHYRVRQYHIHPPTPHLLAMKEHCECDLGWGSVDRRGLEDPALRGFGDGMWTQKAKRTRSNSRQVVLELLVSLFTVL